MRGSFLEYSYDTNANPFELGPYNVVIPSKQKKPDYTKEATNEEIAQSLAELEYDDISDIVDRAYQIKSMKTSELKDSTSSHGPM